MMQPPSARLKTFGPLVAEVAQVQEDGTVIWHPLSRRAKRGQGIARAIHLLKLLLSAPSRFVPSDVLMEALWPDARLDEATARLSDTAYVLRLLLRPTDTPCDLVPRISGGYQLAPYPAIWVDADAFTWHVERALLLERFGDTDALLHWQRAYELAITGMFLADEPYSEWAAKRRDLLIGQLKQCVHRLSVLYREQGNAQEAEWVLRTYLSNHPTDEDALRPFMELLGEQERYQEALAQYARTVEVLQREQRRVDARTKDIADYVQIKQIRRQNHPL